MNLCTVFMRFRCFSLLIVTQIDIGNFKSWHSATETRFEVGRAREVLLPDLHQSQPHKSLFLESHETSVVVLFLLFRTRTQVAHSLLLCTSHTYSGFMELLCGLAIRSKIGLIDMGNTLAGANLLSTMTNSDQWISWKYIRTKRVLFLNSAFPSPRNH
jgi:hypothetical protein